MTKTTILRTMEHWSLFFLVLRVCGGATQSCRSPPLTYTDLDRHFQAKSNLFFLFGVEIYQPFLNEDNQTSAEASLFIVAVCKTNSTDCLVEEGSLPSDYELRFAVGDQSYTDRDFHIDQKWHRMKRVNDDFLYRPLLDHGWYDDPKGADGSIWKNWVMNMNRDGNESMNAKWVEFSIQLHDAGMQRLEGAQIYRGQVVQQFQYYFSVPTFECLQPPSLFFDDFLSTQTYVSAFHFRIDTARCYIQQYSCQLQRLKRQLINTTYTNTSYDDRQILNITVDDASRSLEPLTLDQITDGTTLNDYISEKVIIEGDFLPKETDFSHRAICTHTKALTSRKFLLCAEGTKKNDSLNSTDRVDIILCQYKATHGNQCNYSRYEHILTDHSRLLLPIQSENITFIGFLRLPSVSPPDEWRYHLDEPYSKLFSNQLRTSEEHSLSLASLVDPSAKPLFYSYQIVTDQNRICSLLCERNCTQNHINDTDYFLSNSKAYFILYCVRCQFSMMISFFSHPLVTRSSMLTPDTIRFEINTSHTMEEMVFSCVNQYQQTLHVDIKLYTIELHRSSVCSIESRPIHPFHDSIELPCQLFLTRSQVYLWAITKLDDEEVRIWLNPIALSTKTVQSKRVFEIHGIPHGDGITIEIQSPMFGVRERYSLELSPLTGESVTMIQNAPDGNYFASAFHLVDHYLHVLDTDLAQLKQPPLSSIGLNHTTFLISLIDYYRLLLQYMEKESLHRTSSDFTRQIYSTIASQLLKYDLFYLEANLVYRDHFLSLLLQLSSKPLMITYDVYHLLRHTVKFIASSLPDLSLHFLIRLLDLCVQLRVYILDPSSMPLSRTINSRNLFQFGLIISQVLVSIHRQIHLKGLIDPRMQRKNHGPLDFLIEINDPFVTDRWALRFDSSRRRLARRAKTKVHHRTLNNVLDIIYYPLEYIPLSAETAAVLKVDYQITQLLTVESDYGLPPVSDYVSRISFSLKQNYLNISKLLQNYFYEVVLNRAATNHYSHRFTFEMNTTSRTRNISLIFFDLPNSEKYLFTINIAYNQPCVRTIFSDDHELEYTVEADLWENDYFVYSIPIRPMSTVCAEVEIVTKDAQVRETKRTGYFLVLESGCYSFDTTIFEDYYKQLREDQCGLINAESDLLNGPQLTCACQPSVTRYVLLCQPKPIRVQFELNAKTWLYFYVYLVILLLLLLMLGLCAIYRDTLDNYKSSIHFVHDNHVAAATAYSYQLTMFTGLQQPPSKDLKVYVRLIGQKGLDVTHCLNAHTADVFQRGAVDQFYLTTFLDLGPIVALNVWQNDTRTKSDFYLRHCILYDIVRHRTYYFCCYSWLSLRKSINTINELFYVAQEVDQKAFGHLFLCTYAWLIYHYFLIHSVFKKQRMNTLRRLFRLQLYFCLIILQLYLIHWILLSCQNRTKNQRCLSIFPSFSLLVDQSFVKAGWSTIYQIIRRNIVASLAVSMALSFLTALLTPWIIWCSTLLTNRLELYRQLLNATTNDKSFHNLHGLLYTLTSGIIDFHSYYQDVNQFELMHKFDLQHRFSMSTLGDHDTKRMESDKQMSQDAKSTSLSSNSNAARVWSDRQFQVNRPSQPMVFNPFSSSSFLAPSTQYTKLSSDSITSDREEEWSTASNVSSMPTEASAIPLPSTIKYQIPWPKSPQAPSRMMYRFYTLVYYGLFLSLIVTPIVLMYVMMKTFTTLENFSLTSETIFIHVLTILFTSIFEVILISFVSLLNATFFHLTDENYFISPIVEIPMLSVSDLKRPSLDHSFILHRDLTLTDKQLRERIRERFLESSLIRAVRDVIGYILFMIIIILVVSETSRTVETRLIIRQSTMQLLLRDGSFQKIDHLPKTMEWIRQVLETRLFLDRQDYACTKDTCNYAPVPDSPFYLSKSIRIRQIRIERRPCHTRIQQFFSSMTIPSCFAGGKNLMNSPSLVLHGQRHCSGWISARSNTTCADACNYTSVWSALAYRKQTKLYVTHESPWYFQMHLLPGETVKRCNRRRKYYDLDKYHWFDEKTFVIIIEGNLYCPQAFTMTSFVLSVEKNPYGTVDRNIFIEVSDYALASVDKPTDHLMASSILSSNTDEDETQFVITHYLFAALLLVIFTTKLFDMAKFTRNFGFYGFIFLVRTLSNVIDGLLLLLCCYYFLFFYFDNKILQPHNLLQSVNLHRWFVSFRVLIVNNAILDHLIGLICLFAILKLLNLLKFNPKTYLLAETIYQSASGFSIILSLAFVNYFIFTLIARLLFSNEPNFKSFLVAFRVVLISSIKDAASTDHLIPVTMARALWQIGLWLFSAKIIEYFLISFVIQKFSNIRKTHQLTEEERVVGRIFKTFWNYFAFDQQH